MQAAYQHYQSRMTTHDERREQIIELLRQQDEITVEDLSRRMGVSEVTIRKDLQGLEEQGVLTRVRGGAVFSGRGRLELRFAARQQLALEAKRRIARRAVRYVKPGGSIFLDASTTVFQMTSFLRDQRDLTVVTNGLHPALELSFAPHVTTLVIGGVLRQRSSSLVDALSPELLRRLHVDVAFLSGRGFTPEAGLTESDIRETQLKRELALSARQVVVLLDHTKFGQVYLNSILLPKEIGRLVTDDGLAPEHAAAVRAAGIELEIAS